jgi:signal transduction histidine kinase
MGYRCDNLQSYPVTLENRPEVILVRGRTPWPAPLVEALQQRARVRLEREVDEVKGLLHRADAELVLLYGNTEGAREVYQELVTAAAGKVPIRILRMSSPAEALRGDEEASCPPEYRFTSSSVEELAHQVWIELELRRLKAELHHARRELDQHVQQQARFISLLAHDLRNPFHHLRMFPEFIRDNLEMAEPELVRQMAGEACAEVERVSGLLEEMLEYALLQMDRLEVNPQCLPVCELICGVLQNALPVAREKGVRVECNCISSQYAVSDERLVKTVLRNLVANAVKFTDQGDRVDVVVRDFGPRLRVDVQDTGVGLDMDKVRRVFDLGKKLQQSGTREEKGHGYGLFLCDQLLARLNSRIYVSGIRGEGALFFFYLTKCQGDGKGHEHGKGR